MLCYYISIGLMLKFDLWEGSSNYLDNVENNCLFA